jgi:hypothetical protein
LNITSIVSFRYNSLIINVTGAYGALKKGELFTLCCEALP